jgi:uncharacterized protein YdeI (YjbR/CyaY-like superfamily)
MIVDKRNPKVDVYIAHAQPFAQPILTKLRGLFHRACPEVEETIKWGVPFFDYKGNLGGMAGFKKHASWGLWKAKRIKFPRGGMKGNAAPFMNAAKLTDISQLPSDAAILNMIKQAVALNDAGIKRDLAPRVKKPSPRLPSDLAAALKKSARATAAYKTFSPSHQREYVEWITEAKQPETRQRRVTQAIEMMSEGKSRNWKYQQRKKAR